MWSFHRMESSVGSKSQTKNKQKKNFFIYFIYVIGNDILNRSKKKEW